MNARRVAPLKNNTNTWLMADIGATSSRCAIYDTATRALGQVRYFRNDDFADAAHVLRRYCSSAGIAPRFAALAVAAPVSGNEIQMINRDWLIDRDALFTEFDLAELTIINDFHAIAYALPLMDEKSRAEIGTATEYRDGNRAVLGPGSGLGMAAWIEDTRSGSAMCGEGGHVTMAARNQKEETILRNLRDRFGHCSAERVLSGPGIIALHKAMHGIDVATSEEISGNFDDTACAATMEQFFRFLASVSADLALTTGTSGGLFIAGGIVPACIQQIRDSGFRERFEDKNRYRDYMRAIPTYVITDPIPGLAGLAAYISRS